MLPRTKLLKNFYSVAKRHNIQLPGIFDNRVIMFGYISLFFHTGNRFRDSMCLDGIVEVYDTYHSESYVYYDVHTLYELSLIFKEHNILPEFYIQDFENTSGITSAKQLRRFNRPKEMEHLSITGENNCYKDIFYSFVPQSKEQKLYNEFLKLYKKIK